MANIQVLQITKHLQDVYVPHVDATDIPNTEAGREKHILSRALAAYSVASIGDYEPKDVCASITDEFNDNGIDLIHIDFESKKMWLVQSKYIEDGRSGIDCGDINKFVKGVKDLLSGDFSKFGGKTTKIKDDIDKALFDAKFRIYIVLAYSGSQLSKENHDILDPFINENNDPTELMELVDFNLRAAHDILRNGINASIDANIHIKNWGSIDTPHKAIYGIVDSSEIAQLWRSYGTKLFAKNIRHFLGSTDSNEAMIDTLKNAPQCFKYFNNGVSILCDSFSKSAYGGSKTDLGIFDCSGIQIVNGAQTVGTLGEFYKVLDPNAESAEVFVKIISLEGAPEVFPEQLTIANNTQNKVEKKDFVSLSPIQQKLQEELRLSGIFYHIKRGADIPPLDDTNFSFEEAATALAVSQSSVDLAVLAKREVGKLWEKWDSAPYTDLFNDSLTPTRLISSLKIFRSIQSELKSLHNTYSEGRNKRILVLGNLFIAHLIMQKVPRSVLENKSLDVDKYINETIKPLVSEIATATIDNVNAHYEHSNIPQLFRNYTKCRDIKDKITR